MFDPATFDPATFDWSKLDMSGVDLSSLDLSNFDLSSLGLSGVDVAAMMRQLSSEGPVNWDMARQVAAMISTEDSAAGGPLAMFLAPPEARGASGPPPTPSRPISHAEISEFADLVRAAEVLVGQAIDLTGPAYEAQLVTRAEWAEQILDGLHPVIEGLAQLLQTGGSDTSDGSGGDDPFAFEQHLAASATGPRNPSDDSDDFDPLSLISGLMPMLVPMLVGVQAGFMAGHLARIALTRHDLPLPLTGRPTVLFVAENVDDFEQAWGLDRRDFRFTMALHEITHAYLRAVPWLRDRIVDLAVEYVTGYRIDPQLLEGRLGTIDPTDPASFELVLGDPDALLGAMHTPAQEETRRRLQTLVSVLEGVADHVVETVGTPMIPTLGTIQEARRRHRVVQGESERFIAKLLGMELRREHYERGRAFCAGVVERGGPAALTRLWERPQHLPTPNELEAPGLWLARLEIMDDDGRDATGP